MSSSFPLYGIDELIEIGSDCSSVQLSLIHSEVEEREDLVFSLSSQGVKWSGGGQRGGEER